MKVMVKPTESMPGDQKKKKNGRMRNKLRKNKKNKRETPT